MRLHAECGQFEIDIFFGIELGRRDVAGFGGVALCGTGKGEEQGREDGVELRFVVVPLVDATLADGQPRVPGGDVRRGGGGKLGDQLFDLAAFGEFYKEGMLLEFLIETPAKTVDEEEKHGFVFLLLENF